MEALRGLKAFGNVCPFLGQHTVMGLRRLSTQPAVAAGNRLAYLAQTQCPLMSIAYANKAKSFSTSACPATATATVSSPVRGYASIAEQQADHTRRLEQQAQLATGQTAGVAADADADAESQPERVFYSGRPTNALGFAKHQVTSCRPGQFNYEEFYANELDKKHKDKSYRVHSGNPRALSCESGNRADLSSPLQYFNNINRLRAKFPVAHTARPEDEVTVHCSND